MSWTDFIIGMVVGMIIMAGAWFNSWATDQDNACEQKGGQIVKGRCYKLEAIK